MIMRLEWTTMPSPELQHQWEPDFPGRVGLPFQERICRTLGINFLNWVRNLPKAKTCHLWQTVSGRTTPLPRQPGEEAYWNRLSKISLLAAVYCVRALHS
jgi:hypothetical protein